MLSVLERGLTVPVCATGKFSDQVLTTRPATGDLPGIANCTSYSVPGCSMTMLPRHSLLRVSYHMLRPFFQAVSPTFLYWTTQPVEPGLPGGDQYRPIDSNVATAFVPVEGREEVGAFGS